MTGISWRLDTGPNLSLLNTSKLSCPATIAYSAYKHLPQSSFLVGWYWYSRATHPRIFTIRVIQDKQDLGNEHYSSFGWLKPYVTLQNPLGWGSLPRLIPTHNFDTIKRGFFRRSSWQAP